MKKSSEYRQALHKHKKEETIICGGASKTAGAEGFRDRQLALFQNYSKDCGNRMEKLAAARSRISFWRAVTFLAAAALGGIGYTQKQPVSSLCYLSAAAALAVFVLLVRRQEQLTQQQAFLGDYQSAAKDHIARFGDGWKDFPIDGARYRKEDGWEAKDLDIFGKHSLYQYICTAGTVWGQDQLAQRLGCPDRDTGEIKKRQQAVLELSEKTEFSMNFEAAGRALRKIKYEDAHRQMQDFFHALELTGSSGILRKAVLRLFPAVTAVFLLCMLAGVYRQAASVCFVSAAFIQLMAACICYPFHNRLTAPVYKMNQAVAPYRRLIAYAQQESFESPYLCALKEKLLENGTACAAFRELEKIADAVCARHNVYAFVLYNSLFLYDFQCAERFIQWKTKYQGEIRIWMETIGKIEALQSLAVIGRTKEVHVLPRIEDRIENKIENGMVQSTQKPVLSAADIRHPLLNEKRAVGNDIELKHHTCVITGSNMSGKTTFMRSIGVNLVLAYAGGFCTARSFTAPLMQICTSMRVEDDVNAGISTFYAELLRIKRMIEISRKQTPMIALIDEIYKGTNSRDRISAAKETVRNLSKPYAFTILTTHDFELCDLEKEPEIDGVNYYFSEHYEKNQILFDYKMKKGRCRGTNARYLLRMAGILADEQG